LLSSALQQHCASNTSVCELAANPPASCSRNAPLLTNMPAKTAAPAEGRDDEWWQSLENGNWKKTINRTSRLEAKPPAIVVSTMLESEIFCQCQTMFKSLVRQNVRAVSSIIMVANDTTSSASASLTGALMENITTIKNNQTFATDCHHPSSFQQALLR